MSFHPLEQLTLILQAVVEAQTLISCYFFAGEEAIRPDAIIEVDYHHLAAGSFDQVTAIVIRVAVPIKPATLNENVDRQFAGVGGVRWGKYIGE